MIPINKWKKSAAAWKRFTDVDEVILRKFNESVSVSAAIVVIIWVLSRIKGLTFQILHENWVKI